MHWEQIQVGELLSWSCKVTLTLLAKLTWCKSCKLQATLAPLWTYSSMLCPLFLMQESQQGINHVIRMIQQLCMETIISETFHCGCWSIKCSLIGRIYYGVAHRQQTHSGSDNQRSHYLQTCESRIHTSLNPQIQEKRCWEPACQISIKLPAELRFLARWSSLALSNGRPKLQYRNCQLPQGTIFEFVWQTVQ